MELALGRHEGHAVNGKIAVVGREHHRAFVPAGQQHGAGIGVVHLGRVAPHEFQHLDGSRVLDLHSFDQFPQPIKCRALIPEQVRRLGHGCTRYDKRPGPSQHFCRSPKIVGVQAIDGSGEGTRIKYYDRRGCGHG